MCTSVSYTFVLLTVQQPHCIVTAGPLLALTAWLDERGRNGSFLSPSTTVRLHGRMALSLFPRKNCRARQNPSDRISCDTGFSNASAKSEYIIPVFDQSLSYGIRCGFPANPTTSVSDNSLKRILEKRMNVSVFSRVNMEKRIILLIYKRTLAFILARNVSKTPTSTYINTK